MSQNPLFRSSDSQTFMSHSFIPALTLLSLWGGGGLFVPAPFSFGYNFLHERVMGLKFYDFS